MGSSQPSQCRKVGFFLTHPISGRRALYANPGYTIKIDGWPEAESNAMLDFLFAHQLREDFRYVHQWTEGDVLMWDNISTLHNARPDYGPDERRLIKRCQVMADWVFDPAFARQVLGRSATGPVGKLAQS